VNQHARELYAKAGPAAKNVISQPGNPFKVLWKSLLAMGYVKIANSGIVTRTAKDITLTKPEHAHMAEEGVSLFKEGEAMKRAWPVEVDNVQSFVQ
jgi:hypothetical protein